MNRAERVVWPFRPRFPGQTSFYGQTLGEMAASREGLLLLDRARDWSIGNPRLRQAINEICDRFAHEIESHIGAD
ncbi:MAG TPA: hypothetical protein VM325_16270 [Alphaproteobacteria bacterium]|nr:hypothetical protein [Alphaproteobacteria bacterium]